MNEYHDAIEIVEYNSLWPALYEQERQRIAEALGPLFAAIHHIGSTAVPGLSAKPIIDIMIAVPGLAAPETYARALEPLGYAHRPLPEEPDRLFFRKGMPRTQHVHIVEEGSWTLRRHLLLRDYLRAHPQTAREYEQLKRDLAARFKLERDAYTRGKTEFIGTVVALAQTWADGRAPG